MATIEVKAGGDLQAALTATKGGDIIELAPGARFVGQFRFPPKDGVVTLRSAGVLPDRRLTPADAPLLATIASGVAAMAVDLYDSKNWTLDGLRFEPNVAGAGEVIGLWRSDTIVLRRLLLVVPALQQQKRFILGNGTRITLTQSHCEGVWISGQDSQCFVAWDGAGPYTITDNFLEAASENVMFGGADSSSDANRPKDILIEGNDFTKRASWKGDATVQVIKNLLEFKDGSRITVSRNAFRNNWGGEGQRGMSLLITPRNQDGTAPWTRVEDVLIEQNTFTDVDEGISVTGYDNNGKSGQTTRVVIRDNTLTVRGLAFLLQENIGRLEIYRNIVTSGQFWLSLERGITWASGTMQPGPYAVESLVLAANQIPGGALIHSPEALGESALSIYTHDYSLTVPGETGPPPPPQPPPPSTDPLAALKAELATVKAEAVATKSRLDKLLADLRATPSVGKVAQLVAYLRGVTK